MFEFSLGLSKHILIANMADTASIEHQRQQLFQPIRCSQNMSCSLSSGRNIEWPQFPKLRFLRHQTFPLRLGSARGLALGRGSWGHTPLHLAAAKGHDSVIQRLLEAKAAADAKENEYGRGLGGGYWWGNLMKHGTPLWGSEQRCWWFTDGSTFWIFLVDTVFTIFGKRVKTFARMFGVVVCEHNYIVPTLWVGVFLTQGF